MFKAAFASVSLLTVKGSQAAQEEDISCTLCIDGSTPGAFDRILPDATIAAIPLRGIECGSVDPLLQAFVPNRTSEECAFVQAFGPYCQCPTTDEDRSSQCNLCCPTDNTSSMQFGDNELPFLEAQFGFIPTCALLDAFLMSVNRDDALCSASRDLLASYCGCNSRVTATPPNPETMSCTLCESQKGVAFPTKELGIEGFPVQTCGELESAVEVLDESSDSCSLLQRLGSFCGCPSAASSQPADSCVMCSRGSLKYPNRTLPMLADLFYGYHPTCEILEAVAESGKANSEECRSAQVLAGYCGCEPPPNSCRPCGKQDPSERDTSYDDHIIPQSLSGVVGLGGVDLTCAVALEVVPQYQTGTLFCSMIQQRAEVCGCNGGVYQYNGAHTTRRKRALLWCPRTSGFLSLFGAAAIIQHVLRTRERRRNLYCQLMLGMSILDFLGSIAWILMAAARPRHAASPVLGTHGTYKTCKLQTILVQCGVGSTIYSAALLTYFFFVIVKSKRATWLEKQRWWLHGIPIVATLAFSMASIPFANAGSYGCNVYLQLKEFIFYPIICISAYCVFMMAWIVYHVRKVSERGRKWRFPGSAVPSENRRSSMKRRGSFLSSRPSNYRMTAMEQMERSVLRKACLYVINFLVTWPIVVGVQWYQFSQYQREWDNKLERKLYWLYLLAFTLAPLQGAFNCLVFFYKKGNSTTKNRRTSITATDDRRRRLLRLVSRQFSVTTLFASSVSHKPSVERQRDNIGQNLEGEDYKEDDLSQKIASDQIYIEDPMDESDELVFSESLDPSAYIVNTPSHDEIVPSFSNERSDPDQNHDARADRVRRHSQTSLGKTRRRLSGAAAKKPRSKSFNSILTRLNLWSDDDDKDILQETELSDSNVANNIEDRVDELNSPQFSGHCMEDDCIKEAKDDIDDSHGRFDYLQSQQIGSRCEEDDCIRQPADDIDDTTDVVVDEVVDSRAIGMHCTENSLMKQMEDDIDDIHGAVGEVESEQIGSHSKGDDCTRQSEDDIDDITDAVVDEVDSQPISVRNQENGWLKQMEDNIDNIHDAILRL